MSYCKLSVKCFSGTWATNELIIQIIAGLVLYIACRSEVCVGIYHNVIDAKYKSPLIIVILVCCPLEVSTTNYLVLSPLGGGKMLSSTTNQKS